MKRSLLALASATAVVASLAAAPVITAGTPSADAATVTVDGQTVTVSGALAADLPTTGAVDDAGDVAPMTGHDITEYSISFPEAGKVAFHLAIDANPATGFVPALTQYAINPSVGDTALELVANATATSPGQLEFASQVCAPDPDTGTNTCTPSPVDGEYADGVITWFVPTGAAPGTMVSGGQAEVNPFFEVVWFVNGLIDSMQGGATNIPAAKLLVGGEVVAVGTLSNNLGFEVTAELAPGTYEDVTLELCQADFGLSFNECTAVDVDTIIVEDDAVS